EHYVYGVLNSELHYSNPIEALKAQAVAVRSFGELNLNKHSADGFDLCATTHCQVYKGYSDEYSSTVQAADETCGEMLYSNETPVTAFYFKNSGGYTQNVEDVWAYRHPYLRAVKDEYSPVYPWSTSLSFDTIEQKMEAAGCSPGTIQSIAIKSRNSTGAVSELRIVGSSSTVTLDKEKIRNVLGATIVKSLMFRLEDSDMEGSADSTNWKISNGSAAINPETNLYVISGSGTVTKSESKAIYGSNGTSTVQLGGAAESEIVTGGTACFNGYGYGHGVGMPQDSAVEMAKQGFSYDEILKYYYTDIEIK
ncbi:MAG: SpoIID/LytB domain-containing protein, partial [Eubacteriales bacterium]|nr:SpoIID/LytB domain-containing protein [Eubacteriales bacterium]